MSLFDKKIHAFLILFMGFTVINLGACGYKPLYADRAAFNAGSSVGQSLAKVKISIIADREGQILRNQLLDSFYSAGERGNYEYILDVRPVKQRTVEFDVTEDSDITRAQLKLSSNMKLRDIKSGKVVLSRELRSFASYNILDSQYATRVSREKALENALHDMARHIEINVALFLDEQK